MSETWKNKLYYGDNLEIMREHIAEESVDLIYLDPPFNSKATYNVLFRACLATLKPAWILTKEAIYGIIYARKKTGYNENPCIRSTRDVQKSKS